MKVFISWSGEESRAYANLLCDWLTDVLQKVPCWVSTSGITSGENWIISLNRELTDCTFGIACITEENISSPWIHYEAGAIAQKVTGNCFCPLLFNLKPSQIHPPLSLFQARGIDEESMKKLAHDLNRLSDEPMLANKLEAQFRRCWGEFSKQMSDIVQKRTSPKKTLPERTPQDVLEEILALTRKISLNTDFSFPIYIDTSIYTKSHQTWTFVSLETESSVSDFLDSVYLNINSICNIKAYTYGSVWVLKNLRTGITYDDIGILYAATSGEERDNRPVTFLDIKPKDVLQIIKAPSLCAELYTEIKKRSHKHGWQS